MGQRWSDDEKDILQENLRLTDLEVARLLRAAGHIRTAYAVKQYRHANGLTKRLTNHVSKGWPVMHGTFEQRDRRFCGLVIAAARREGLLAA